jgi:hypothetical protein
MWTWIRKFNNCANNGVAVILLDWMVYVKKYFSVANSWPNFSARSTKNFGRWRKNSAPYKIFSQMPIKLSFTYYFCQLREQKLKDIRGWSVLFCRYLRLFIWKLILKKVRPLFGPFLAYRYLKKIWPPIFPAAQIFVGPLLSSAAEISAPRQHWNTYGIASL